MNWQLSKIALGVAFLHFFSFYFFKFQPKPDLAPPSRLVVAIVDLDSSSKRAQIMEKPLPKGAVSLQEEKKAAARESLPKAEKSKSEKKTVIAMAEKSKPPPVQVKKTAAKTQIKQKNPPENKVSKELPAPSKPKIDAEKAKLLMNIRDKIANIGKKGDNFPKEKGGTMVAMIDQLQSDGISTAQKLSYQTIVAAFMRQKLRLPEEGAVTISVALAVNGKVLNLSIDQAKSELNRQYVQKTVPTLQFPRFEGKFERTLTLTLTHEI